MAGDTAVSAAWASVHLKECDVRGKEYFCVLLFPAVPTDERTRRHTKNPLIVKAGTTFPATAGRYGDFEEWTLRGLRIKDAPWRVIDVRRRERLPLPEECRGVVVTGSHAMVTEENPWSLDLEAWIPPLVEAGVPFFGICYGHQLLARAMGGTVGYHPAGEEIGTVEIDILPGASGDPLFGFLPNRIPVHVTHEQTVLSLPDGALRLAANSFEPNHAFRIGTCAWGVQFHPEYTADIMQSYISEQSDGLRAAGKNPSETLRTVRETPDAAGLLERFGRIVEDGTFD
jgi:GMP synthase (glutamine-hydrolysing)